jgi:hypothetical protein
MIDIWSSKIFRASYNRGSIFVHIDRLIAWFLHICYVFLRDFFRGLKQEKVAFFTWSSLLFFNWLCNSCYDLWGWLHYYYVVIIFCHEGWVLVRSRQSTCFHFQTCLCLMIYHWMWLSSNIWLSLSIDQVVPWAGIDHCRGTNSNQLFFKRFILLKSRCLHRKLLEWFSSR